MRISKILSQSSSKVRQIFLNGPDSFDAERKVRTHRLIEHGAILESIFPEIVLMTGEQVKTFLEKKRMSPKGTG